MAVFYSLKSASQWFYKSKRERHLREKQYSPMTLLQKNQLNSLKSRAMRKSKLSKQEFDFDINQNISSSSFYPAVLKANSTLSSFMENVRELLNTLKGT